MKSSLPKVLHPILGKPLVWYSLEAARQATGTKPVVVVGHGAEKVREAIGDAAEFVLQEEQLGTGHAVQQAEALIKRPIRLCGGDLWRYASVENVDTPTDDSNPG